MAPEPDKKKFRASLRLSLLLSTSVVKQHDLVTSNYMSLAVLYEDWVLSVLSG